jgi:hypothetical protein
LIPIRDLQASQTVVDRNAPIMKGSRCWLQTKTLNVTSVTAPTTAILETLQQTRNFDPLGEYISKI